MDISAINQENREFMGGAMFLAGAVGAGLSFYYDAQAVEKEKATGDLNEVGRTLLNFGKIIGILAAVAGIITFFSKAR